MFVVSEGELLSEAWKAITLAKTAPSCLELAQPAVVRPKCTTCPPESSINVYCSDNSTGKHFTTTTDMGLLVCRANQGPL